MGTTYKGLYLPSTSETAWTASINANFTTIADGLKADIFLPAATGINQAGSPASTISTFPNQISYHSLVNAATNGATWVMSLPLDCSAGVVARPVWFPSATDASAHAVRWSFDLRRLDAVDIGGGPSDTVAWTGGATARVVNKGVIDEVAGTSTALTLVAGSVLRVSISRIGADALDTYVGNVQLLGLTIGYA
jgi:hypothetical protein